MQKTLLLLSAHTWEKEFAIKTALKMGVRLVMISDTSDSQLLRFADKVLLCDPYDVEKAVEIVSDYNKTYKIDGVVGLTDYALPTVTAICEKLGLKKFSMDAINSANDKFLFREKLKENDLPYPEFALIKTKEDLKQAADKVGFPAILKPRDLGGSVGVFNVSSYDELVNVWDQASKDAGVWHFLMQFKNHFVLESCMSRKPCKGLTSGELSIECISFDGHHYPIAFVDKHLISEKYPVEIQHVLPTNLDDNTQQRIMNLVSQTLNACGVKWGVSHNEIIVSEKKDVYVEFHLRPAGDCIIDLVYYALGINMYEILFKMALGIPFDKNWLSPCSQKVATIKFFDFGDGIVGDLKTLWKLSTDPNIIDIKFMKKQGDKIQKVTKNYFDRYGYIVCVDDSVEAVTKRANNVINRAREIINDKFSN